MTPTWIMRLWTEQVSVSRCQPLQPPTSPGRATEPGGDRGQVSSGAGQREGNWNAALTRAPGSSGRCQLLCAWCPLHCHLAVRELIVSMPAQLRCSDSCSFCPSCSGRWALRLPGTARARLQCRSRWPGHLWAPLHLSLWLMPCICHLAGPLSFPSRVPLTSASFPPHPALLPQPWASQSRCSAPRLEFTLRPPGGARTHAGPQRHLWWAVVTWPETFLLPDHWWFCLWR